MRELDATSITDEVLHRISTAQNPRLKQVLSALVRHLHDFAREVELTEAEWFQAIGFLTRTGQFCSETRQEFILLSDVLGLSTLVDALNNPVVDGCTQSTVIGPFFVEQAPDAANGDNVDPDGKGGKLFVQSVVRDTDGVPIEGATVDIWHSDEDGFYDIQYGQGERLARRARFTTDAEGKTYFWSTVPASYPVPHDGPVGELLTAIDRHPMRPAHVHFMITAPGYRRLITHVFVEGDEYLDTDAVFGVKESLVARYVEHQAGTGPDGTRVDAPYRTLSYEFGLLRSDVANDAPLVSAAALAH